MLLTIQLQKAKLTHQQSLKWRHDLISFASQQSLIKSTSTEGPLTASTGKVTFLADTSLPPIYKLINNEQLIGRVLPGFVLKRSW